MKVSGLLKSRGRKPRSARRLGSVRVRTLGGNPSQRETNGNGYEIR